MGTTSLAVTRYCVPLRYTATLDQLATQRERNRIARELHDILAHSLSGLAVHLEGIDSLWDSNPQKARKMLGQARAATESGLAETRRALQAREWMAISFRLSIPQKGSLSANVCRFADRVEHLNRDEMGYL